MNIQANLQDLKTNFNLNSSALNLYCSLAEVQKTIQQQFLYAPTSQPYIFPKDQLIMQSRISSLNNYLRNIRNLSSASKLAKTTILQIHKEKPSDYEQLKLNSQESKLSIETTDSDSQRSDETLKGGSNNGKKHQGSIKKTDKSNRGPEKFDPKKRRNYWLPHEDQMLTDLIELHGPKWTKIASCLQNRTGKQVRDRYLNYLKPSIKQKAWTMEEDELLDKLYIEFGNKWSKIASALQGRTENQVKNRYYSGIRKGKSIKKLTASDQSLKIVKIEGEESSSSNALDETVWNEKEIKNEDGETSDLASESCAEKLGKGEERVKQHQIQKFQKTISGSKRFSPYEPEDQLSKKLQTNPVEGSETIIVKIENQNAENTICVKHETS